MFLIRNLLVNSMSLSFRKIVMLAPLTQLKDKKLVILCKEVLFYSKHVAVQIFTDLCHK